jgi:molybdate transport system substrate-binding protein
VADPAVPAGKYTMQMLDAMAKDPAFGPNFMAGVLANVVSREDNVKSVVTKVRLGEVDAGVVYASDVTGDAARDVGVLAVPSAYNQMAQYPIAVTAHAAQPDLARQFEDFVLSAEGQQVLKGFGFLSATTQPTAP